MITADMLPSEGGEVIRFFYQIFYPTGATVDELLNSPHRCFRDIGKHFAKEGQHGNDLL